VYDLRAVCILLSHPGIAIKAIEVSDGQVKANEGYARMSNLLDELKADTIPVFLGEPQDLKIKENTKDKKKTTFKNPGIFPPELFQPADTQITMVCLGPLTNTARETENNPVFSERVEEVTWLVDSVNTLNGFNYESDITSADRVLNSGIRLDVISILNKSMPVFDSELMSQCKKSGTNISKALFSTSVMTLCPEEKGRNLSLPAEEVASLFLGNHELFELSPLESNPNICFNTAYSARVFKNVIMDMINGQYRSVHFVALYRFPVNPELYVYDVRQILEPVIRKYGIEE